MADQVRSAQKQLRREIRRHRRAATATRLFFCAHRAPAKSYTKWRQCNLSVGVDAHIDPATRNHKTARIFGEIAQCPVGADASVRPWGNGKFAATYHKNECASCGESAASTPTNMVRIRQGAPVFMGAFRRADRGVRPYGCARVCVGAPKFVTLYRREGQAPPLRYDELRKISKTGDHESLAEFCARRRKSDYDHFCRRRVRRQKFCSRSGVYKFCAVRKTYARSAVQVCSNENLFSFESVSKYFLTRSRARKAVAFRASAGEGGGRVLMMPARPPPGEICRAPLRQSAADANAAGHTAASADRAWLLRRTLLHAPAGTSALLCMEIGIPVLESSESLWQQYARRARRHTRKNSPFSCN